MNIVLVIGDDNPAESIPNCMPMLNAEPGGHWTKFSNGITTSPECETSRGSILTGLYVQHHGILDEPSVNAFPYYNSTIGAVLRRAGYRTGLFGKFMNWHPDDAGIRQAPPTPLWIPKGWDDWHAFMGVESYYNYTLNENGVAVAYPDTVDAQYSPDVTFNKANAFLQTAPEPFFAYVASMSPHDPNIWATRHNALYPTPYNPYRHPNVLELDRSDKPEYIRNATLQNTATLTSVNLTYRRMARCLAAVDEGIMMLINTLVNRGVFDRTVILFLADNSNLIGEHSYTGKAVPYEEAIAAQMRVRWPGVRAQTLPQLVSNIDVAPTFAAIARTRMPYPTDGADFGPLIRGERQTWRSEIFISMKAHGTGHALVPSPWKGIRTETEKYVEYDVGDKERYDLVNDPYEMQSLISQGDNGLAAKMNKIAPV